MSQLELIRQMEWEKIKGSLQALLCTYPSIEAKKYDAMKAEIDTFVTKVEDEGLAE